VTPGDSRRALLNYSNYGDRPSSAFSTSQLGFVEDDDDADDGDAGIIEDDEDDDAIDAALGEFNDDRLACVRGGGPARTFFCFFVFVCCFFSLCFVC
jgi:hypothetical protein